MSTKNSVSLARWLAKPIAVYYSSIFFLHLIHCVFLCQLVDISISMLQLHIENLCHILINIINYGLNQSPHKYTVWANICAATDLSLCKYKTSGLRSIISISKAKVRVSCKVTSQNCGCIAPYLKKFLYSDYNSRQLVYWHWETKIIIEILMQSLPAKNIGVWFVPLL